MTWIAQLVTVVAVLAGAGSTYVLGKLADRDRYARDLELRWDQRRLDAYIAYVTAAKLAGVVANAILNARINSIENEAHTSRLDALAAFDLRRNEAFEALPLIADGTTIEAAHELNHAVWKLAHCARAGDDVDEAEWLADADKWLATLNNFHAAARASLSVVGTFARRDVAALAVSRPERAARGVMEVA